MMPTSNGVAPRVVTTSTGMATCVTELPNPEIVDAVQNVAKPGSRNSPGVEVLSSNTAPNAGWTRH